MSGPQSFDDLPVLSEQAEGVRWFLMPNEAHEYLQGRTTPLTTRSFNPKRYATKPSDSCDQENDVLTNIPIFERTLERRNTFRKSVSIEAGKVHPLEKKVKKRRKFRIFSRKKSTDRIARRYLAEGSGSGDAFTRQPSIVLHVREEPVKSGSQTTVFKRWLSSEVLTERKVGGECNVSVSAHDECPVDDSPTLRKNGERWFSSKVLTERKVVGECNISVSVHDECPVDVSPTLRKKWRERMKNWFSGKQ